MCKTKLMILVSALFLLQCTAKTSEPSDVTADKAPVEDQPSKASDPWQVIAVKDDFGDVIKGKSTVAAEFKGTMANSATANAPLTVRLQVTPDSVLIAQFFEYNKGPAAKLPPNEYVNIKIKPSSGETMELKLIMFQDMLVDSDRKLLNLLRSEKLPIKVIVDLSKLYDKSQNTAYNFSIDPAGLKEAMRNR